MRMRARMLRIPHAFASYTHTGTGDKYEHARTYDAEAW